VDGYEKPLPDGKKPPLYPGAKPTTYHQPYDPNVEVLPLPCCPDPYDTHVDGAWAFGDWLKK